MAIFGIRDAIKRTVSSFVGSPPANGADTQTSPPTSPFVAAPAPSVVEPPIAEEAEEETPVAEPEAVTPAPAAPASDLPVLDHDTVWALLDEMVRPALQGDGGDITLIKVENNDVHVRLVGACSTCPSSIMTMKMGVEALLREEFPQLGEVIQHD